MVSELPPYLAPYFSTDPKMFFDFAETLHIDSTPKVNFLVFGVKRENFLVGLKIDFEVEKLGFLGFFS